MARYAVPLRNFEHGRDAFRADGKAVPLSDGHFADWEGVALVRAATPEEIAEATRPRRRGRSRAPR